jgi:serine/threonine protein kinase
MERITSDLRSADDLTQGDLISIVAQILIAVLFYQSIFKISHNDLHTGNIFLEKITNKTKYNGKYLKDYGFISYNIYGKEYYVPLGRYLVKIGDWGLSCKYSKPMVLSQLVIDSFAGRDKYFDEGTFRQAMSIIPNVYRPSYDLIFTLIAIYQLLMMSYEEYNVVIDVVKQFIEYITNDNLDNFMATLSLQYKRPNLTKLKEYMSMQDIISEGIMLKDLMEKPNKAWLRVGQLL